MSITTKTAFQLREDKAIRTRILIGEPTYIGQNSMGEVAVFEGDQVVMYEVKLGRSYQGFLVKTGRQGGYKLQGIYPGVELLIAVKTAKKVRQLSSIASRIREDGGSLESLSEGVYARLNALFQGQTFEWQDVLNVLNNKKSVATAGESGDDRMSHSLGAV